MIPFRQEGLPSLTEEDMREVDRFMIEEYGIELIQMMENAGRNLARLVRERFLKGDPRGRRVAVLAGPGGNGGGAIVTARHLHNWGASVDLIISRPEEDFKPVSRKQLDIVRRMEVPLHRPETASRIGEVSAIIDGLIGYGLKGAPKDEAADLIRWANRRDEPICSLDIPSGIGSTEGTVYDPTVRASVTMTLAMPKRGLFDPEAGAFVGELYLADIGVPPELYESMCPEINVGPIFAEDELIRLR
jgi:NAD(P)H-hydrate epimerase